MYKLIATDMDGTLLNSDNIISKENEKYIILAQEKGVKFALASGRPLEAMIGFQDQLKLKELDGYIIAYNGAQILECSTGKTIFSMPLNEKQIKFILEMGNLYNITFATYLNNFIYTNKINQYSKIEANVTQMKLKEITSIIDVPSVTLFKFLFISEPDKIKEFFKTFKEQFLKYNLDISISNPYFLEIVDKHVNKGLALEKLCENLNISLEETITCGDSYNDIPMLENSGLPVASANARDAVKEISKYISVHHNDDVLKDIIKKYVLIP